MKFYIIPLHADIPADIPKGYQLIEAYARGKDIKIPCQPEEGDLHDCDWEGCTSTEHVIHVDPFVKYSKGICEICKERAVMRADELAAKLRACQKGLKKRSA